MNLMNINDITFMNIQMSIFALTEISTVTVVMLVQVALIQFKRCLSFEKTHIYRFYIKTHTNFPKLTSVAMETIRFQMKLSNISIANWFQHPP